MPIYEYRCIACDRVFEVLQTIRQHDRHAVVHCPDCDGSKVERRVGRVTVETDSKSYHPAKPLDV